MSDQKLIHRLALSMMKGVGPVTARELVAYCGGVDELYTDPIIDRKMLAIPRVGPELLRAIKDHSVLEKAKRELEYVQKNDIRLLFYLDKEFPRRLSHCSDAPIMLHVLGNANVNPERCVAIVGTRKSSDYGKKVCRDLIEGLSVTGATVISGLAYGIDIMAHRAALEHGLPTMAGVAHGLDRLYPGEHNSTAKKMEEQGGLITELPSGSKFHPGNFPARNRIVAGMSDCTVVIESASKGGSLITADIANSYNRDVFAIPGRVDSKSSMGCNELIRDNKSGLITGADDLIKIMGWQEPIEKKSHQVELFAELGQEQLQLVNTLRDNGNLTIDELCIRSRIPQSKVAGLLLDLEFRGIVRSLPGKVYSVN